MCDFFRSIASPNAILLYCGLRTASIIPNNWPEAIRHPTSDIRHPTSDIRHPLRAFEPTWISIGIGFVEDGLMDWCVQYVYVYVFDGWYFREGIMPFWRNVFGMRIRNALSVIECRYIVWPSWMMLMLMLMKRNETTLGWFEMCEFSPFFFIYITSISYPTILFPNPAVILGFLVVSDQGMNVGNSIHRHRHRHHHPSNMYIMQ